MFKLVFMGAGLKAAHRYNTVEFARQCAIKYCPSWATAFNIYDPNGNFVPDDAATTEQFNTMLDARQPLKRAA